MANFNLRGTQQTCTQALHLSDKNVRLASPPHQKTFLICRLSWYEKTYLVGKVGENCLIQV